MKLQLRHQLNIRPLGSYMRKPMEKNKGKSHQKEQRQKQRTQLNLDGCTKMRKLTRRKKGGKTTKRRK